VIFQGQPTEKSAMRRMALGVWGMSAVLLSANFGQFVSSAYSAERAAQGRTALKQPASALELSAAAPGEAVENQVFQSRETGAIAPLPSELRGSDSVVGSQSLASPSPRATLRALRFCDAFSARPGSRSF
jgi:hypothetical protein